MKKYGQKEREREINLYRLQLLAFKRESEEKKVFFSSLVGE